MNKEDVQKALNEMNLIEEFEKADIDVVKMGKQLVEWYEDDVESRKPWYEKQDRWLKLATQVVEQKTSPWPGAANIKYPLLTTAAMQFAARAYPALVPGPNLVNGLVIGRDQDGMKKAAADRIGKHMSFQLLYEMPAWEEDMDRLCLMLPIVGCLFKKTYYDEVNKCNKSDLILPTDLVIDYYAKSVEEATRKCHVLYKTPNEIKEREALGIWDIDFELGEAESTSNDADNSRAKDAIQGTQEPKWSPATPHKFLEYHCWWDSDGDGYEEPYIITVHYKSQQVVRIVARYELDGVQTDEKGNVTKITPTEFFTKYGFIPNPDGSVYDLGFGLLLGGLNETVNTLTNQLLDAGTLSNLQSGFLGKGIRVRAGNTRFSPGEWKPVDFTGDDIKKHIFPMPTKEPSAVLFKLLETLVTSGKELASVAEIMVGKMPGQNTPATTTMASIEQGLKVFTAIYKRVYRALGKEYDKLFKLNALHTDETAYFTINQPTGPEGQQVYRADYDAKNLTVKPNADPNVVSQAQKLMAVQSMGSLLQLGTINPKVYTKRFLEAIGEENIEELTTMEAPPQPGQPPPPPGTPPQKVPYQAPPGPDQQQAQADMQLKQMDGQQKAQESQQRMQFEQMKASLAAQGEQMSLKLKMVEAQMEAQKAQLELMTQAAKARIEMHAAQQEHVQGLIHTQQQHQQQTAHAEQQNAAKVQAMKAQAAAKPKPTTKGK